jgi:O-antigen/teichoic acid export membrane protein
MLVGMSFHLIAQILSAMGMMLFTRNIAVSLGPEGQGNWISIRYAADLITMIFSLSFPQVFIINIKNENMFDQTKKSCIIYTFFVMAIALIVLLGQFYYLNSLDLIVIFSLSSTIYNLWRSYSMSISSMAYSIISAGPGIVMLFFNFDIKEPEIVVIYYSALYGSFGIFLFARAIIASRNLLPLTNISLKSLMPNKNFYFILIMNFSINYINYISVFIIQHKFDLASAGAFSLGLLILFSIIMFPINILAPLIMRHAHQFVILFKKIDPILTFLFLAFTFVFFYFMGLSSNIWIPIIFSSSYNLYSDIFNVFICAAPLIILERILLSIYQSFYECRELAYLSIIKVLLAYSAMTFSVTLLQFTLVYLFIYLTSLPVLLFILFFSNKKLGAGLDS